MNRFIELNDGNKIPLIGFGTWRLEENRERQVVEQAIEVGYRFFDTASLYGTERAIGAAVNASNLPRQEFFLASKVWLDEMGYQNTIDACNRSLERLDTDFIDLYMIHWPKKQGMTDSEWKQLDLETWQALEFLASEGKVKSIGVSNFLPHHLNNLLDNCEIVPAINQLELHAGYFQEAAVQFCEEKNIKIMSWGSLGRGKEKSYNVLPIMEQFAHKYGKTPQQIYLRYLLQRQIIPLPKSNSKQHMIENIDVFDFNISEEDMWIITCMPQDCWLGEHPDFAIPTKKLVF